jgi:RecA-family ATPase
MVEYDQKLLFDFHDDEYIVYGSHNSRFIKFAKSDDKENILYNHEVYIEYEWQQDTEKYDDAYVRSATERYPFFNRTSDEILKWKLEISIGYFQNHMVRKKFPEIFDRLDRLK